MHTNIPSSKHKPILSLAVLPVSRVSSWITSIIEGWKWYADREALRKSLEHLDSHILRDIGLWREPESRTEEWWRMNPPP